MGNCRLHTYGYVFDSDQQNTNGERNNWGVSNGPSITHECPNKFHKITSILNGVQSIKVWEKKKNDEKFLEILYCDNDRNPHESFSLDSLRMQGSAQTHRHSQIWQHDLTSNNTHKKTQNTPSHFCVPTRQGKVKQNSNIYYWKSCVFANLHSKVCLVAKIPREF